MDDLKKVKKKRKKERSGILYHYIVIKSYRMHNNERPVAACFPIYIHN